MVLLHDYEEALRYEDDPRRLAKYRKEIERQRKAVQSYQREYDDLKAQEKGQPSARMDEVAAQLKEMTARLDQLQTGQQTIRQDIRNLNQAVLGRFDASEQKILTSVVEQLDQTQLAMVQGVLDAIETDRISEADQQEALASVTQILTEIKEKKDVDPKLASQAADISRVLDDPKLETSHKLKISLPVIPLILRYEGEIGLKGGLNLKSAWQSLKNKMRGRK